METRHPENTPPLASDNETNKSSPEVSKEERGDIPQSQNGGRSSLKGAVNKTASHHRDVPAGSSSSTTVKQTSKKHPHPRSNAIQAWRDIFSGHKSQRSKDSRRVRHRTKKLGGPSTSLTTVTSQNFESGEPSTFAEHVFSSKLGVCVRFHCPSTLQILTSFVSIFHRRPS